MSKKRELSQEELIEIHKLLDEATRSMGEAWRIAMK
jgi:hypothetical protein